MRITIDKSRPPLGEGRFGSVYKAVDQDTGNAYAAKVFDKNPAAEPRFGERLCQQELRMLRKVQGPDGTGHPNVLKLVGTEGLNTIILQLAPCGDLLDEMQKYANRGVPGPATEKILRGLLQALDFLHTHCGLMHGDVKPENIMMADRDTPLLADFDASVELGATLPFVRGTEEYLPPEFLLSVRADLHQFSGGQPQFVASGAADVWAAGMIALALCTGVHAWNIAPPPGPESVDGSDSGDGAVFWLWRSAQKARAAGVASGTLPAPANPWRLLINASHTSHLILSILLEPTPRNRPSAARAINLLGAPGVIASEVQAFEDGINNSGTSKRWHFWHIFNKHKENASPTHHGHSRGWHLWHSHKRQKSSRSVSPQKRTSTVNHPDQAPRSGDHDPDDEVEPKHTRGRSPRRREIRQVGGYRHGWHLWGGSGIDSYQKGWKLNVGGKSIGPVQTSAPYSAHRSYSAEGHDSGRNSSASPTLSRRSPRKQTQVDLNEVGGDASPSRSSRAKGKRVESYRDSWKLNIGGHSLAPGAPIDGTGYTVTARRSISPDTERSGRSPSASPVQQRKSRSAGTAHGTEPTADNGNETKSRQSTRKRVESYRDSWKLNVGGYNIGPGGIPPSSVPISIPKAKRQQASPNSSIGDRDSPGSGRSSLSSSPRSYSSWKQKLGEV